MTTPTGTPAPGDGVIHQVVAVSAISRVPQEGQNLRRLQEKPTSCLGAQSAQQRLTRSSTNIRNSRDHTDNRMTLKIMGVLAVDRDLMHYKLFRMF